MKSPLAVLVSCLAVSLAGLSAPQSVLAQDKIPVETLDDLPRHTYQIEGKVSELLTNEAGMAALMSQVEADLLSNLEKYAINDATTLKGHYGTLLAIVMMQEEYDQALEYVALIRDLEDKQSAKLMTGQVTESMIAARRRAGDDEGRYRQAFQRQLQARLERLPWDVVGDDIEAAAGRAQIFGENLILGIVSAQMDPTVEMTGGELSLDLAQGVVSLHYALESQIPLKEELIAVYNGIIESRRVDKQDIWEAREVTLEADEDYQPVVVAIWDSGVDVMLFPHQLWRNVNERYDGTDSDGNGYVDDVHGITYDIKSQPVFGYLHPVNDLHNDLATVTQNMKGFTDLQAAVNSPEAAAVRKMISELDPDEVEPFIEDFGLFGNFSHGTHVSGIAARGNPYIRILVSRLTFGYKMRPEIPTLADSYAQAGAAYGAIQYYKDAGVRVVNMSWGGNRSSIEGALEANGVGETAEERAEMARRIFKVQRDGLYEAMASAPEILFVTSAGNSDNDVEFDEMIPSGFDLPNLLVVGAVDQAGDPTGFTSFGGTVDVYANGFEVDSYLPGGERMKMSGTSMSSPNVVNLAAKVLAAKPDLTPEEVIALIVKASDDSDDAEPLKLINPKRTMELVGRD